MKKKIIIGILVAALVAGGAAGGTRYYRKSHVSTVNVVSVDSLASDYYVDDTTLDGSIVSSAAQNITVDKDMIIQEVSVAKGDTVKKGDKLITFDMTLVQMELNIAKLKQQQMEQDLTKAQKRLTSLQNGGPIEDTSEDSGASVTSDSYSSTSTDDTSGTQADTGDDELASAGGSLNGAYLASAIRPVLAAAQTAELFSSETAAASDESVPQAGASGTQNVTEENTGTSSEESTGTPTEAAENTSDNGDTSASDSGADLSDSTDMDVIVPEESVTPTPAQEAETTVVPDSEADISFDDGENAQTGKDKSDPDDGKEINTDITDGEPEFYTVLDGDTEPYMGTGTEEDPYVFFVSSAKGYVIAKGSFLNKMAGYQADGTKPEGVTGYWYQLEFHTNDTVADLNDRKSSCSGYYLVDGSLLESMVSDLAEVEFSLDGASHYDDDVIPDDGGGDGGGDDGSTTMTRDEAIKQQKTKIESLNLDIRESKLNITKLEKKVNNEVIYSKLDGTVSKLGDPTTGAADGDYFMTIKSGEGFYIKGTVSELMLDQMQEGTVIKCSGDAGEFEAEVVDVSEYPVSGDNYSYWGNGNPNVSYYVYTASIPDKTLKLSEDDWITVSLQGSTDTTGIVLDKAVVRSENGTSYVYKDDNGVLKKQIVTVGGNVNSGYSVLIKGGITRDDKIAFPYGDDVKDGAKTKEVSVDTFYGY